MIELQDMSVARLLFLLGAVLMFFGCIVLVSQRIPWVLSWFGNLPGDIRYEREHTALYVPLGSMLVVSIILTLVLQLVERLFR
jgi:hypothetical protein